MKDIEAGERLFAEFPEFAAWYRAKNDPDDDHAFGPWTAFGLGGFATFLNEQIAGDLDPGLVRRCLAFVEELAREEGVEDLVEVNVLENLGHLNYPYDQELREKARAILGPASAALLIKNEQGWRDLKVAIAKDPSFEPHWVRMKVFGDMLPPLDVKIYRATRAELDAVLLTLTSASSWLHSIGITEQWPASFVDDPVWADRFGTWIDERRVYIGFDAARGMLGCFRLMDSDEHIWVDEPGSALYLHSLAVWRFAAGWGVAQTMLDWALRHAARRGVDELRLDCWAGNERLRRYYLEAGFEFRGEARIPEDADQLGANREYWVVKFAKKVR